jgi:hypothetical protein
MQRQVSVHFLTQDPVLVAAVHRLRDEPELPYTVVDGIQFGFDSDLVRSATEFIFGVVDQRVSKLFIDGRAVSIDRARIEEALREARSGIMN